MHRTPYNDDYETCDKTHAELRIYSGELSPREVSLRLGIEPTVMNEKGKTRISITTGRERVLPLNLWLLSSEGHLHSKDLRRHLDWLLDQIEPAAAALRELEQLPDATMNVHCSWWSAHGHGGPTLWPQQMRRVAALNLELAFEIMFLGDDEQ